MKVKSAIKHSRRSIPLHMACVAVGLLLAWVWTNWIALIVAGVSVFALAGDIVNVVYIRRQAKKDPTFLDRKAG